MKIHVNSKVLELSKLEKYSLTIIRNQSPGGLLNEIRNYMSQEEAKECHVVTRRVANNTNITVSNDTKVLIVSNINGCFTAKQVAELNSLIELRKVENIVAIDGISNHCMEVLTNPRHRKFLAI